LPIPLKYVPPPTPTRGPTGRQGRDRDEEDLRGSRHGCDLRPARVAVDGGERREWKGRSSDFRRHLFVPDATYGQTVTASANPGGEDVYVSARCWLLDGTYVFAAFYPVLDGQASIGPLEATTWPDAPAHCTAEEGYFTRNDFGKWVILATDAFEVAAA
jgi:hypothetical protein